MLMFTNGFIFTLFFALSCDVSAEDLLARQMSPASGIETLVQFNNTPEFLADHPGDATFRQSIANQCEGWPVRHCIDYIEANRPAALASLPNNPDYWLALHQLLAGPTPEFEPTEAGLSDPRNDKSKLIDAVLEWGYRTIANDDRAAGTKQFVLSYRGIRRQMAESYTLIDRMIFIALVGIAHQQVEMLMAAHIAEGDLESIQVLTAELTPFSKQETSLHKTLLGEAQYIASSLSQAKEISAENFLNSAYVPAGSLEEMREWALQTSQKEVARIQKFVREVSERSWHDYWGQGFTGLAADDSADTVDLFLMGTDAYNEYVKTSRSSEVMIYPLLALGDIYLGRSSPGLPARAAPSHWQWDWSEKSQEICLVPTHVAPGTSDFTLERPACVTYQADGAVRASQAARKSR